MRIKKLLVAFLVFTMIAAGLIGNVNSTQAATGASIVITDDKDLIVKPGETTHLRFPIRSESYIYDPSIEVTAEGAPFTISNTKLTLGTTTVTTIPNNEDVYLEFDVKVKATASIDVYPISIKVTYNDHSEDPADPITIKTNILINEEKTPVQLTVSDVLLENSTIGSDTNLSLTVKNEGELMAKNAYLLLNYNGVITENYSAINIKIGDLASGDTKRISLPIKILTNAIVGRNKLIADFTYKTVDGDSLKSSYNLYVNLKANESAPQLNVDDVKYNEDLKPGDKFNLSLILNNDGAATASNITVSVDDTSISTEGILRDYFTDGIWVPNIKKQNKKTVEIPLVVSKYATGGLKEVKINISYTDESGVVFTISNKVYLDVIGKSSTEEPNIIISGVKQSPAKPIAGEKLDVSFYIENKSAVDITELKIYTDGLIGNTFIPIDAEPYQYIEKLESGAKKHITIPLIVSESITEGLNNLKVTYSYAGSTADGSVTIPVRDVVNDLGSKSKPKLIVSKYVTDVEELRAGSTFNFTFDIYNTHSSIAAKNITVTITQADNVFTVAQGSNSFFINKIDPSETVQQTIEMKVKSDATTKAYPIKIAIEYEYDGAEPNPTTGEIGETKTEELNLQAIENSRPVVDNVNVYSWEGAVMTGTAATLAFEFYNMGKSPLNNVIATVEGDFVKSDGTMYFIGNVAAGSSTYAEFEVMPNMEGRAKGVLKITFEDSNGDQVSFTKDFETDVMPASAFDPGIIDGGTGEVFNPEIPLAKKAILPTWLFIILQIVIFVAFIPITRKIIISVYKSKLRKKELEQY